MDSEVKDILITPEDEDKLPTHQDEQVMADNDEDKDTIAKQQIFTEAINNDQQIGDSIRQTNGIENMHIDEIKPDLTDIVVNTYNKVPLSYDLINQTLADEQIYHYEAGNIAAQANKTVMTEDEAMLYCTCHMHTDGSEIINIDMQGMEDIDDTMATCAVEEVEEIEEVEEVEEIPPPINQANTTTSLDHIINHNKVTDMEAIMGIHHDIEYVVVTDNRSAECVAAQQGQINYQDGAPYLEDPHDNELKDEVELQNNTPANNLAAGFAQFQRLATIRRPLKAQWTLWYLEKDIKKLWMENQVKVITVGTIEDFWFMYGKVKTPSELTINTDYSFFRNGIQPMWEDPANIRGGRWIITMNKHGRFALDSLWLSSMLCIIDSRIPAHLRPYICGVVATIRYKSNKIAIWLAQTMHQNTILALGYELKHILRLEGYDMHFQFHLDAINNIPYFAYAL